MLWPRRPLLISALIDESRSEFNFSLGDHRRKLKSERWTRVLPISIYLTYQKKAIHEATRTDMKQICSCEVRVVSWIVLNSGRESTKPNRSTA
jgi:hypothetical protein